MKQGHEKQTLETLMQSLAGLKPECRRRYKADIRGVFGSYARGEAKAVSDLDVLVEFDAGANLLDLVGLSMFLEETLKVSVDIVPESAVRAELREQVFKEKIAV